jgi:4-amino-4-deoxy-L-arabinose transferase-like glycosyltransferase
MLCAAAAALAAYLAYLTVYPQIFIDESWLSNAAWTWVTTGVNFDVIHQGSMDQFGHPWVRRDFLGTIPWAASYKLFGLGFFQGRLASWSFGVLLVACVFLVGRREYGGLTGAAAALLLTLSAPFFQASHYIRPEIVLATAVVGVYGLAIAALDRDDRWVHFACGLLLGLCPDIHLNGVVFTLGVAALYLAHYGRGILRHPGPWWCAAGSLLGFGYYGALHILPSPHAYLAPLNFNFGGPHKLPLQTLQLGDLLASIRGELTRYHFFPRSLDFAMLGAAVVYLAVRRNPADRRLMTFVGAVLTGFILVVGNKSDLYAILFYPFFVLAATEALISLSREQQAASAQRIFVASLLALWIVSNAVHIVRPIYTNRDYDYYAITNRIRPAIARGARVMGLPHWWLGLSDVDYRSSIGLTFYHAYNGLTLTEGLERIRPDVVIVDATQQWLLRDGDDFPTGYGDNAYGLPRREFEAFLKRRGTPVLSFTDPWHGEFHIYQIRWN